jgi:glycosyltransferase involved in cell wall biosynthesis
MKISVVTPSYNQGQYLEETIQSVLAQDYRELEYILIDGGSDDSSVAIIEKYQSQIDFWVSERDRGQTHAINKGFQQASGEIIAWINSDDVYCPDVFLQVAAYFESHPECNWLAGNILFMNESGQVTMRKYPNTSRWLERNCMMSLYQPNIFLRRSILSSVGYPSEDYHMMMDYEWYARIAQVHPVHLLDLDIAKFRLHSQSKSWSPKNSPNKRKYHQEALSILSAHRPHLRWFLRSFPGVAFHLWLYLGKLFRFSRRLFSNQLHKLNDTGSSFMPVNLKSSASK